MRRRRRIVDLPLNATEDRVSGTVDVARALRDGERALEPGLLAEANRGILYVDEINLLDDHLTDVLLDAAALGVNVVEREGVSVSHPARFLLVGTMNEEEGELRPQIADRIGLEVEVEALARAGGAGGDRAAAGGVHRRPGRVPRAVGGGAGRARGAGRGRGGAPGVGPRAGRSLRGGRAARRPLRRREPPRRHHDRRVREGARGARRPRRGRTRTTCSRPRSSRSATGSPVDPFAPRAAGRAAGAPAPARGRARSRGDPKKSERAGRGRRSSSTSGPDGVAGRREHARSTRPRCSAAAAAATASSARGRAGGRGRFVGRRRGKYARHRLARPGDARRRAGRDAARRGGPRRRGPCGSRPEDLRRKVREHRSPFSVCFVVDNSWSVHAERMVEKVKGVVFELLEDATRRGDKVALVAFKGGVPEGTVVLPPTASLAAGEAAAARRSRSAGRRRSPTRCAGPVCSCAASSSGTRTRCRSSSWSATGCRPCRCARAEIAVADALAEARSLRRARIGCVVAEVPASTQGHAAALAEAAGGQRLPLERLAAGLLVDAVEATA